MNREAMIFDMDGVLWDSGSYHERAFRDVLREKHSAPFEYARLAGRRTREALAWQMREWGLSVSPDELERMARRKTAQAVAELRTCNPVFPGAIDLLERLQMDRPLALATSGSEESMNTFLAANAATAFFQATLHGGNVERGKPAPDIYEMACHRLGRPPGECWVVEDAEAGVTAGHLAGCRVLGVSTTVDEERLLRAGADTVAATVTGLAPKLGLSSASFVETMPLLEENLVRHAEWTAVIPAAGRGTRLGHDQPKILFPVAGRPILDWLLDLLLPRCGRVVVVASPDGAGLVNDALRTRCGDRGEVAIQPCPDGMGDAVWHGLERVRTPRCLVVWGDQVALRPETIAAAQQLHQQHGALATVPTLWRDRPYVHFSRHESDGRLKHVAQAREGDSMPLRGESDTGLFLFQSAALRRHLHHATNREGSRGARTGELNFLPILVAMDQLAGNVLSARIADETESVGVNSREEAAWLAPRLLDRSRQGAEWKH